MKNAVKYICVLLLLVGVNVSMWGDCTLYGGVDGNTVIGVISSTTTLEGYYGEHNSPVTGWTQTNMWTTVKYAYSTTYPGSNAAYTKKYDGQTPEEITALYAVYQPDCENYTAYSGSPYVCYHLDLSPTSGASYASANKYCLITAGTSITITAYPDEGKSVDGWLVENDNTGMQITPTGTTENTFTFSMPASNVSALVGFADPVCTAPTVSNSGMSLLGSPTSFHVSGGKVTDDGGCGVTKYGYVYNTTGSPTWSDSKQGWNKSIEENTQFGSGDILDLTAGTTYYVRPFAYNGTDYGYGDQLSVTLPYAITLSKNTSDATAEDGLAEIDVNGTDFKDVLEPTRDHYSLEGYYTDAECTQKIADESGNLVASVTVGGTPWTNSSGQWVKGSGATFYAKWTIDTHVISFDANGGSGSMDDVEQDYGSTYALPACGFTAPSGKVFDGWAEGSAGGTKRTLPYNHTVTGNITFYALWRDASYTDYVFSCAELTLTGPTGDLVFITSAASKTVRSQEAFHVTGSGLTPSTTLTFAMSDPTIADKFAFKQADGSAVATDASGAIDMDFYVFYTPTSGDTEDGLDIFTNLSASISGTKPKASAALTDKTVIGRHLPTDFVIAAKKDGKWWALPSDMASTTNPKPSEIAVNDINNPSVAYTDASNKYGLAAPTASNISGGNGQYIRLTMSIEDGNDPAGPAPLFGTITGSNTIGKSGTAKATSDLSAGWWWQLKQTNTSITNPQDAKYTIYCANNTRSLSLRDNAGNPDWGLFASGVEELRLIPASSVVFTEAEIVAWGHHNAIVEVDKANAGGTGVAAEKVKAILNGAESSLITLAETKTSNGTGATKYDYTVAFGDVIDFAANEGQMLTLEWYNSSDVMIAVSNIIVPRVIATTNTMYTISINDPGWNTEVHVLPGVTLTADAGSFPSSDVTIKELNIYPGATVNVTTGTLKATTLVMRNGWNRLNGDKKYDVARLYITPTNGTLQATNAYADWYIDFDQYYPIAVPWEVDLSVNDGSKIWYKNTRSKAVIGTTTGSVRLRYYDGASRAANVQVGVGESANWKLYGDDGCNPIPVKLEPGKAYAMTAKRPAGKAFSIIRMPLTIPSAAWTTGGEKGVLESTHKDQVTVSAYGDASTPSYAKGWNFIANPYMSLHKGALSYTDEGAIEYANIPDIDFQEYDQVPIVSSKLKPASGFLIQAPKSGTVTFGEVNRQASAPSYRKEVADETMPIQRAYITLAGDGAEDMMGILVGENYTAEYETNADLAKLLSNSNTLRTYMYYGEQNMAYLAISPVLAQEWIPVQVRIPAEGEYTFSLDNASVVENLEGVYLIDYANNDQITNLIEENYTFTTSAGTINGRFAINAVVGTRQTPTAIDVIGEGNKGNGPVKFIYHENVYIWHNGIIYDATGKKVK